MSATVGSVRHRLLTPHPVQVTFAERGFHARDTVARELLEHIGLQFLAGFEFAMRSRNTDETGMRLETVERAYRGFAYEGAAMAYGILDGLVPLGRRRVPAFAAGPAGQHVYMVNVGAGWAMARLPWPLERSVRPRDPLLRWLALDGYGFHEAYFHTSRVVGDHRPPKPPIGWGGPPGQAARVIDQGIGRALWFVCGADVERIATVISGFGPARHPDLWSGTGLAAAYATGAGTDALDHLVTASGAHRSELAQGAAFAAKARLLADLVTPDTTAAVAALCGGLSVEDAAKRTDAARDGLAGGPDSYLIWRERIREGL